MAGNARVNLTPGIHRKTGVPMVRVETSGTDLLLDASDALALGRDLVAVTEMALAMARDWQATQQARRTN